jgi:hypothetical protein
LDRRLGGPQNRSGCSGKEKNLSPAGIQTQAAHPIASRFTDWAQRMHVKQMTVAPKPWHVRFEAVTAVLVEITVLIWIWICSHNFKYRGTHNQIIHKARIMVNEAKHKPSLFSSNYSVGSNASSFGTWYRDLTGIYATIRHFAENRVIRAALSNGTLMS